MVQGFRVVGLYGFRLWGLIRYCAANSAPKDQVLLWHILAAQSRFLCSYVRYLL